MMFEATNKGKSKNTLATESLIIDKRRAAGLDRIYWALMDF